MTTSPCPGGTRPARRARWWSRAAGPDRRRAPSRNCPPARRALSCTAWTAPTTTASRSRWSGRPTS
ncbi:hypothetical protein E1182_30060 [Micromonospora sp. KC721]|nr:hypothetical protein E1182_30060 [Micromonospora sp. KC721]